MSEDNVYSEFSLNAPRIDISGASIEANEKDIEALCEAITELVADFNNGRFMMNNGVEPHGLFHENK